MRPLRAILVAALVALAASTLAAQAAPARPTPLAGMLLGPTLARAEVVVAPRGEVRLLRVDRGQIRALGPGSITLRERDGTTRPIALAPDAVITGPGRLRGLRRRMLVATVRDGTAPAHRVHILRGGAPLPPGIAAGLLGAAVVRADVVLGDAVAGVHAVRVERGRIRSVGLDSITLLQADASVKTVRLAPDATVTGIGRGRARLGPTAALRRGMFVETVAGYGDPAAERVHVVRR